MQCTDSGGSMLVHAFGAAFGLTMCILYQPATLEHPNN